MAKVENKKLQDLHKVLDISRSMVATVDLDNLLGLIVQRSMELLDSERATVFLYDQQNDQLVSRIAAGEKEIRFPADRGIAGAAITSRSIINIPDAYADERFHPEIDKKTGFRTRNILAVPLADHEGNLVGVLQILNKRKGNFEDYDITLAETLGAQAGVAIQRGSLIQHYIEKQQLQRSLEIARDIQQNLLPSESPKADGFDIAGFCEPADETGGDTYDFLQLPDGRWMLVIADASGHGIGPAMVIAETRAMLRAVSMQASHIEKIMPTVNNLLTVDLDDGRFVTCFFGLLDPDENRLLYCSAGHGPMLFYGKKQDKFERVSATTLPLGIMEDIDFETVVQHDFAPGDFAVITTDGIFEAVNKAGDQFGIDRMKETLKRDSGLPAEKMVSNLCHAVDEFTAGLAQADDITAVIIKKN